MIKNKYLLYKNNGYCFIYKNNLCLYWFIFSLQDYDVIKKYTWNYSKRDGYIKTKNIFLTKILFNTSYEIDHINRIRNDNRRENLRIVTKQENLRNRNTKNNTGFKGVYKVKYKYSDRYIACISPEKYKIISFYCYSLDEAINKRKELENIYYNN